MGHVGLKSLTLATLLSPLGFTPAIADDAAVDDFVSSNIIGIFYHELGHALIDVEGLPIFGQEEDAADVASIFLIDAFFEEESAQSMAYAAALGFWAEAEAYRGDDVPYWDVHGPDEQRFYNTVCLFYGADPDTRADFAEELGLPEERAEYCPGEYDQAAASWGAVLDDLSVDEGALTLIYEGGTDSLTESLIAEEVAFLNSHLALSQDVVITVESCGEANAFYDPEDKAVIMCSEFEDELYRLAESLE